MTYPIILKHVIQSRTKLNLIVNSHYKKHFSIFSTSYSTSKKENHLKLNYSPKICIVGSGPAALYTAQYTLKSLNPESNPTIDIYEKLPVPFGLVRYGVAPDHQDVKNVINSFTETLKHKNVNFFGNVNIGSDLKIDDLLDAYNAVVLAYGSHSENYLNIKGEKDYENLVSAKDIVSLYNGLPDSEKMKLDISGKNAVIIGAGNVAIDIARILLSPIEKLAQTDISAKTLDFFKEKRKIENVTIVARRGVLNAAFTLKELRELTKIESIQCKIDLKQFHDIHIDHILNKLARPRKRITEYMYSLAKNSSTSNNNKKKTINFMFLRTPIEILGNNPINSKQVSGVKFKVNKYAVDFTSKDLKLDSEDALNSLQVVDDNDKLNESLPADLVVRSIGYKNVNIDESVPFDKKLGVVLNQRGKVVGKNGLYCTGWIKRGPRGVIVDTTSDAYETAHQLCDDLVNVNSSNEAVLKNKAGTEKIINLLKQRNVRVVDKIGWNKIDEEEKRRGKELGKPREKFQSIDEMLSVAFK